MMNRRTIRSFPTIGLGLRQPHIQQVLRGEAQIDWLEIISENYMNSAGRSFYDLQQIAELYPLVMHGVSLSIGSTDPLNREYLTRLKRLADTIKPMWVSDHLCWTGIQNTNSHDLLPLPLNQETLAHVISRINQVQDFLERPLVLENPSTYAQFKDSDIDEPDFLRFVADETGCGLLLDVNNVTVTCFNAGQDPMDYLQNFPFEHVVQMHLAGHQDLGTHKIDTHDQPVDALTWCLFSYAWQQTGGAATCLEWDSNIPSLKDCEREIFKARNHMQGLTMRPTIEAARENAMQPFSIANSLPFSVPQVMENIDNE